MKIHAHQLGLAAGLSMSFWFFVCAVLMWIWPAGALKLTASLMHMTSLSLFAPYFQVTLVNFLSGFTQCFVYTYLYTFVLATIYNRLTCKSETR